MGWGVCVDSSETLQRCLVIQHSVSFNLLHILGLCNVE
jgi:hypothetical protein